MHAPYSACMYQDHTSMNSSPWKQDPKKTRTLALRRGQYLSSAFNLVGSPKVHPPNPCAGKFQWPVWIRRNMGNLYTNAKVICKKIFREIHIGLLFSAGFALRVDSSVRLQASAWPPQEYEGQVALSFQQVQADADWPERLTINAKFSTFLVGASKTIVSPDPIGFQTFCIFIQFTEFSMCWNASLCL